MTPFNNGREYNPPRGETAEEHYDRLSSQHECGDCGMSMEQMLHRFLEKSKEHFSDDSDEARTCLNFKNCLAWDMRKEEFCAFWSGVRELFDRVPLHECTGRVEEDVEPSSWRDGAESAVRELPRPDGMAYKTAARGMSVTAPRRQAEEMVTTPAASRSNPTVPSSLPRLGVSDTIPWVLKGDPQNEEPEQVPEQSQEEESEEELEQVVEQSEEEEYQEVDEQENEQEDEQEEEEQEEEEQEEDEQENEQENEQEDEQEEEEQEEEEQEEEEQEEEEQEEDDQTQHNSTNPLAAPTPTYNNIVQQAQSTYTSTPWSYQPGSTPPIPQAQQATTPQEIHILTPPEVLALCPQQPPKFTLRKNEALPPGVQILTPTQPGPPLTKDMSSYVGRATIPQNILTYVNTLRTRCMNLRPTQRRQRRSDFTPVANIFNNKHGVLLIENAKYHQGSNGTRARRFHTELFDFWMDYRLFDAEEWLELVTYTSAGVSKVFWPKEWQANVW